MGGRHCMGEVELQAGQVRSRCGAGMGGGPGAGMGGRPGAGMGCGLGWRALNFGGIRGQAGEVLSESASKLAASSAGPAVEAARPAVEALAQRSEELAAEAVHVIQPVIDAASTIGPGRP